MCLAVGSCRRWTSPAAPTNVVKTGRTSITVDVEVYAQRMHANGSHATVKVTEATLTYVATDETRKPRVLPPL